MMAQRLINSLVDQVSPHVANSLRRHGYAVINNAIPMLSSPPASDDDNNNPLSVIGEEMTALRSNFHSNATHMMVTEDGKERTRLVVKPGIFEFDTKHRDWEKQTQKHANVIGELAADTSLKVCHVSVRVCVRVRVCACVCCLHM